jgi:hypothetical protein
MSRQVILRENDYVDAIVIAKSDSVNIADDATNNPAGYPFVKAIQVVAAGNIVIIKKTGADVAEVTITVTGALVGSVFNFPIKRINSTNTTATVIGLV